MLEITGDSSRFVGLSVTFVSSQVTFIKNFLSDESHDEVRQFDIELATSSGIESKVIHLFRQLRKQKRKEICWRMNREFFGTDNGIQSIIAINQIFLNTIRKEK